MNPRLHSCQDLQKVESPANDKECLNILLEYTGVSLLGSGQCSNVVLELARPDTNSVAVKILRRDRVGANEIRTMCKVNDLIAIEPSVNSETMSSDTNSNGMFCQTFGYISCGEPPERWRDVIPDYNGKDYAENYFIVTELGNGMPFSKITYRGNNAVINLKSFLFELFFGLAQAFTATGFRHNDLHGNNVLVTKHWTNSRNYTVNDMSFEIRHQLDYPKIIDYGLSTFIPNANHVLFDVSRILQSCRYNYRNQNDTIVNWIDNLSGEIRDMTSYSDVLTSKYFADLQHAQEPAAKRQNQNANCHICRGIATREYQHAPSYKFCDSNVCVRQMGPIAQIL